MNYLGVIAQRRQTAMLSYTTQTSFQNADDDGFYPRAASVRLEIPGVSQTLRRGENLVSEGAPANHVFHVMEGVLRVTQLLPDGGRYISRLLAPGDYFGFATQRRYIHSVDAANASVVFRYSKSALADLIARDSDVARQFFKIACRELVIIAKHAVLMGARRAPERVAAFLLTLVQDDALHAEPIRLPMSRGDIGDYLGMTRETVSRALTRFRDEGVIDLVTAHEIAIVDCHALESIANGKRSTAG